MTIPAYLDSLAGLIPCQVVGLDADGLNVICKFRSQRARALGFEGTQSWPRRRVVPREKILRRSGWYSVRPYVWEDYFPSA